MTFLFDNRREYGYEDLLRALNEGTNYYPYYKTSDVFSYFVNLIVIELFVDLGVRAKIQIQYVFSHFSPSG